jgi:two-component system sensor histidine kinase PilS (NtrC family)
MQEVEETHSWFGPTLLDERLETFADQHEFRRLWLGFMTARVTVGLVLLLLHGVLFSLGQTSEIWLMVISATYFANALLVRSMGQPIQLGRNFDFQWFFLIGVDVLAFSALQFLHGSSINYTALFALPILLASVLGPLLLAMGTAAGVTLLLLLHELWLPLQSGGTVTPHFVQFALTGAGSFGIAFLAHQLSARLASEEQRARRSQYAARVQQQVNDLVIESMTDGILVLDAQGKVHAANPSARQMLQADERPLRSTTFHLSDEPAWQSLVELMGEVFTGRAQLHQVDIHIQHEGQGTRHMRAQTRLTPTLWGGNDNLCVMFLQDQREMEARMRTEKLASMGRMSAAVAHEIRNPLAAIAQANALLDEDLTEPRQRQLTRLVQQNAERLEKIVEEVLNISRVSDRTVQLAQQSLLLNETVARICSDWAQQSGSEGMLRKNLSQLQAMVDFDDEHLRRVLVNLLDNARRYASQQRESIQISTQVSNQTSVNASVVLSVWSDSAPLEPSVERHLFEPFFSSESRSSGLGLYICRELCEGHGGSIAYQRSRRIARGIHIDGNEFLVTLRRAQLTQDLPAITASAP